MVPEDPPVLRYLSQASEYMDTVLDVVKDFADVCNHFPFFSPATWAFRVRYIQLPRLPYVYLKLRAVYVFF